MARVISLLSLAAAAAAANPDPFALDGAPIWAANDTSDFALFRAPDFVLRSADFASATLYFSALGSPRPPAGTVQAKLLGAAAAYVNGVLVSMGPGHGVPSAAEQQAVRGLDVSAFLRGGGAANALAFSCFWARSYAQYAPIAGGPRVHAALVVVDANGAYTAAATGPSWVGWGADAAYQPTGNAGISWYPIPNEDLDRSALPGADSRAWASPGFAPTWAPAVAAPAWPIPLVLVGDAVVTLARGACALTRLTPTRTVIDFKQEFTGGVNFSFPGADAGTVVRVTLGEELLADGSVRAPMRTGNFWSSNWTLAGDARDLGITHHEMIQFRYAQVDSSAAALLELGAARAWVVQHAAGGTGENPFDASCAGGAPVPAARLWGAASRAPAASPLGALTSSSPALDTVWRFCASSIVATSVDVNVDGQTRERDVDVVDALNTARGQYSVLSPGDVAIQARTARELLGNDTGAWAQWYDFKASSVLVAHDHALWTGDASVAADAWAAADGDIRGAAGNVNSLQFLAGLRYLNGSGNGLLHFPANGSCGGSWACDPLLDWPTTTRDGYDCSAANSDDTARSALGALAFEALADLAGWLGAPPERGARYAAMAAGVRAALRSRNLRVNASEAYFVDGAVGKPSTHAAVHSTVYATAAGAADGDAALCAGVASFLMRHGVAPASCMMGRWFVDALYRCGVWAPEAADAAFDILTSPDYPSWLDMLAQGATVTTEAWRAADKTNMDWAHPWCASPAFTVPAGTLGAVPTAPGWATWRLAPQPSGLTNLTARVPTPAGMVDVAWAAVGGNATVRMTVLAGQTARVCLPAPGRAGSDGTPAGTTTAAAARLFVNDTEVASEAWGRMLCAVDGLGAGAWEVARVPAVAA